LAKRSPVAVTTRKVTNYRLHARQFTARNPAAHRRAILAVLEKQQELARPGYGDAFCGVIARCHGELGDKLYLTGSPREAASHWRRAAAGGVLSRRSLYGRLVKARLPQGLLTVLRRLAREWRAAGARGTPETSAA
jgi:hypothetical protein